MFEHFLAGNLSETAQPETILLDRTKKKSSETIIAADFIYLFIYIEDNDVSVYVCVRSVKQFATMFVHCSSRAYFR